MTHNDIIYTLSVKWALICVVHASLKKMSSLEEFVKNTLNIGVLRKILFAAVFLPQDMPKYWETIKVFSRAELPVSELQSAVQNLQYLNKAAFSTDKQLLSELCTNESSTEPIGIVLISSQKLCKCCSSRLVTRSDRPRKLVLYTESSGTLPATHYRKVCSRARYGCTFIQHYGFHALGKVLNNVVQLTIGDLIE